MLDQQEILGLGPGAILDSLGLGVYVTDVNRRIVYWSRSAQAITGWPGGEIVGKCCHEDVLCHADKDGHRLCGEEYCPLHRAILTDQSSDVPIIVFAAAKNGRRIPVQVSVAPVHGRSNEVVGGVEVFRDLSGEFLDFEKAHRIQLSALGQVLPDDSRIKVAARYLPKDIVGGDCYRFESLGADRYGFFLADVSGHGVSGAVYTMFLLSLATHGGFLLSRPGQFCEMMNRKLSMFAVGEAFATAVCGALDLAGGRLTLACAGGPAPLLVRDGRFESLGGPGLPWGMDEAAGYSAVDVPLLPKDRLLLFTDGATEIRTSADEQLDKTGLVEALRLQGYPDKDIDFEVLEKVLLERSNRIRFDDDVTFLEIRLK